MNTAAHIPTDDLGALSRYARTGDPRAFEILVHRYQTMVLATCLRTIRRHADAEDAAQETFLKLARGAVTVRSNVAAWLHSCAVRTSFDLLRRSGAQARAEAVTADLAERVESPDDRSWRELKPVLDSAIAELSEEDRGLIVERFLAGRAENEMARDARVSPGTMNRRIDRALDRLRVKLVAAGLGIAGSSSLASAMSQGLAASAAPASPTLTASLMQVGLATMPVCGATAGSGMTAATKLSLAAAITLAGFATVLGLPAAWRWVGFGAAAGTPLTLAGALPRPVKKDGPYPAVSLKIGTLPEAELVCTGRRVRLQIEGGGAPGKGLTMRIESAEKESKPGEPVRMRLKIEACDVPDAGPFMALVGKTIDGEYMVKGDAIELVAAESFDAPQPRFRWLGRRAAESVHGKDSVKMEPEAPPAPALAGVWHESPAMDLSLEPDQIRFVHEDYEVMRFKILEWNDGAGEGAARVYALCARNAADAAMIGQRVRLLVRKDENGYTIAMNSAASRKADVYPEGFESKPGDQVVVITCRKEKP